MSLRETETKLPDPCLHRLAQLVEKVFGLHFPELRTNDLMRGLRDAAKELQFLSPEALLEAILSNPAETRLLNCLARKLTIGETYFFRFPKSFEVLEKEILPSIVSRRAKAGNRIRIWSAGCATGEEAYSIAIALDRALPDRTKWSVKVSGTDLNEDYLQQARRGVYGPWSFRSAPEWLLPEYFQSLSDNEWELQERIRRMVEFSCVNLACEELAMAGSESGSMDIIFCRNVLLYFKPERVAQVIQQFRRCLSPDGILFLGASEASQQLLQHFDAHSSHGAMYYTRKSSQPLSSPSWFRTRPCDAAQRATLGSANLPATSRIVQSPLKLQDDPDINRLIEEGRHEDALREASRMIEKDEKSFEFYHLRARAHFALGSNEAAIHDLRRCLYLNPNHIPARYLCAAVAVRRGKPDSAIRLLEASLKSLDAMATRLGDGTCPDGDTGTMRWKMETLMEKLKK